MIINTYDSIFIFNQLEFKNTAGEKDWKKKDWT